MSQFIKNCFWVLTILVSVKSFCQSYNFKNYSTEQGLPQSQVLSVFQDKNGYMWFGTNSGGVAKFDGNNFITFTTQEGLIDNTIYSICNHGTNQILFGTTKGLSLFNGKTFINFSEKQGLKKGNVYKLLNQENKTWVGTSAGVFILDNNTIKPFNEDSLLNKSSVYTIFIDDKKNTWFGTTENGVIVFLSSTKKFKHYGALNGLMSNFVFSISQKKDGIILIGTRTGLNKIDRNFNISEASELPANNNISYSCIIDNGDNEFYFGTHSEGLINYDFNKNRRTKKYDLSNGLTSNPVQSLLKDREGNLWIGTDGSGVYKFYNEKFTYYTKANGLPEEFINTVAEDKLGNLWIAPRSNGIIKANSLEFINYKFDPTQQDKLPDNDINAILPLDSGSVLFGTKDGLCIYENNQFKTYSDELIRHKYILALFKDSKNIIWIATAEGVFQFVNNKFISCDQINLKYAGKQFLTLFFLEDKQNNIWVGTEKGILKYSNSKIEEFNQDPSFLNKQTNCGALDFNGGIWLGTENGLYLFANGTFKKITNKFGHLFGYINFLEINKKNKLFIGSNNGIDILDLTDYYNKKITIKHLGKDDGLLSLESNFGAGKLDSKGRLLIGTVKGLEIYDPNKDKQNFNEALISITDVKLFYGLENIYKYCSKNDTLSVLPKQLVLPFSKNNLTFNFVGISLIAPEKVLYQHKLEGLDEDWAPPSNKTEAAYPSLPPGKYKFLVKATNNDGLWNKEPAVFEFEILAPWYNTWWFYLSVIISVIAIIFIYNRVKTKKLIADKNRLEQIVNIRTKELRAEKETVEVINKEVLHQKHIIEEKQSEIISSINYAQRIQNAVLTGPDVWKKISPQHFILFKPRDIVSGDFYWAHVLSNGRAVFTVADCTGHGVPGGFMSMLGNSFLNEIVVENKIFKADEILNKLRDKVINALDQKGQQQQKDGMDMALCVWNKMDNTIEFAGANNGLYVLRNGELIEYKGNKMPIGSYLETNPKFTSQKIQLEINDLLYMCTDGFPDQFGGPKGKKYKYKQLEDLLINSSQLTLAQQSNLLNDSLENWKLNFEQTDDICMLGIKVV